MIRLCTQCGEWKDLDEFSLNAAGAYGHRSICKVCCKANGQRYRRKRQVGPQRPGRSITPDEYDIMLVAQNGVCAICHGPEEQKIRGAKVKDAFIKLSVDHDHKTGRIRGLLCSKCNRGLGLFRDNPKILKKAIHYLLCP